MPMLRPPDLVDLDEVGIVVALQPGDTVAVRFTRGTFLLKVEALTVAEDQVSS